MPTYILQTIALRSTSMYVSQCILNNDLSYTFTLNKVNIDDKDVQGCVGAKWIQTACLT